MPNVTTSTTYKKLLADISTIYQNAAKVVVEANWQIGQRIVEVEQDGNIRAAYGEGLIQKLSDDLTKKLGTGFSVGNLKNMRQFYLQNKIRQTSGELDWSQYVALLPVDKDTERARLEKLAKIKNLSSRQLRQLAKKEKAALKPVTLKDSERRAFLKRPAILELNTYKIADKNLTDFGDKICIDCGFFVYHTASKVELAKVKITDKPAHTYSALVERVIDGDTIWTQIDIGFGNVVREKLRFRGINAPELGTPEGEAAKKYVADVLKVGQTIVIKTYETDTYGRFVADIFYLPANAANIPAETILKDGIFLNTELLDKGLAVRMES